MPRTGEPTKDLYQTGQRFNSQRSYLILSSRLDSVKESHGIAAENPRVLRRRNGPPPERFQREGDRNGVPKYPTTGVCRHAEARSRHRDSQRRFFDRIGAIQEDAARFVGSQLSANLNLLFTAVFKLAGQLAKGYSLFVVPYFAWGSFLIYMAMIEPFPYSRFLTGTLATIVLGAVPALLVYYLAGGGKRDERTAPRRTPPPVGVDSDNVVKFPLPTGTPWWGWMLRFLVPPTAEGGLFWISCVLGGFLIVVATEIGWMIQWNVAVGLHELPSMWLLTWLFDPIAETLGGLAKWPPDWFLVIVAVVIVASLVPLVWFRTRRLTRPVA